MSEATAQKRRWDLLRAVGRCTQCGNRDARTKAGKCLCQGCAKKRSEHDKRRRAYLKGQGRCTQCGNRDARTEAGRAMCAVCAVKQQEWYAQRKRRRME